MDEFNNGNSDLVKSKLSHLLNPTTLNRFITNFYSFDRMIKSLHLRSENKSLSKNSYFNYVLVKTLVKYEKKLKFSSRPHLSGKEVDVNNNRCFNEIGTLASKSFESTLKHRIVEEAEENCLDADEKNQIPLESSISLNSVTTATATTATSPSQLKAQHRKKPSRFSSFRRREFIMRILDFNFFLLF